MPPQQSPFFVANFFIALEWTLLRWQMSSWASSIESHIKAAPPALALKLCLSFSALKRAPWKTILEKNKLNKLKNYLGKARFLNLDLANTIFPLPEWIPWGKKWLRFPRELQPELRVPVVWVLDPESVLARWVAADKNELVHFTKKYWEKIHKGLIINLSKIVKRPSLF